MSGATPTAYEIVVNGHLDDRWSDWFGDVTVRRNGDGTTSITTLNADQAQLHGLLAGLRDLNAVLVSVRPLGNPPFGPSSGAALRC